MRDGLYPIFLTRLGSPEQTPALLVLAFIIFHKHSGESKNDIKELYVSSELFETKI